MTVSTNRYVALDVETTGLSPQNGDRVIEIGAVAIEDQSIVKDRNLNRKSEHIPRPAVAGLWGASKLCRPSKYLLLKRITIIIALNYEAKRRLKCVMYGKIQTGQSLAGKVMR